MQVGMIQIGQPLNQSFREKGVDSIENKQTFSSLLEGLKEDHSSIKMVNSFDQIENKQEELEKLLHYIQSDSIHELEFDFEEPIFSLVDEGDHSLLEIFSHMSVKEMIDLLPTLTEEQHLALEEELIHFFTTLLNQPLDNLLSNLEDRSIQRHIQIGKILLLKTDTSIVLNQKLEEIAKNLTAMLTNNEKNKDITFLNRNHFPEKFDSTQTNLTSTIDSLLSNRDGSLQKADITPSMLAKWLEEENLLNIRQTDLEKLIKQLEKQLNGADKELFQQLKNDKEFDRFQYINRLFTEIAREFKAEQTLKQSSTTNLTNEHGRIPIHLLQTTPIEQMATETERTEPQIDRAKFIQQFEKILSRLKLTNGGQRLFVRLYPEHLGSLRIELLRNETGMFVKMIASTKGAKELLESNLHALRQAFHGQNIQAEKIEIVQQMSTQDQPYFQRENEHEGNREQQRNNKSENKEQDRNDFTDMLEEAVLNLEA